MKKMTTVYLIITFFLTLALPINAEGNYNINYDFTSLELGTTDLDAKTYDYLTWILALLLWISILAIFVSSIFRVIIYFKNKDKLIKNSQNNPTLFNELKSINSITLFGLILLIVNLTLFLLIGNDLSFLIVLFILAGIISMAIKSNKSFKLLKILITGDNIKDIKNQNNNVNTDQLLLKWIRIFNSINRFGKILLPLAFIANILIIYMCQDCGSDKLITS